MKALFIWNDISAEYINTIHIENCIEKKSITGNQPVNVAQIESENFDNIFILVELNRGGELFAGYKAAEEIIIHWKDESNPPNIRFISFLTQEQLFDANNGIQRFYAKSFYHYLLPLTEKLELTSYSSAKYRYLKKFALTESGILVKIGHEINGTVSNFDEKLENVVQRLKEVSGILGKDLNNALSFEKTIDAKQKLAELSGLISKRIAALNQIVENREEYEGVKEKILLVEDDEDFGQKIKEILDVYFDVDYYNSGQEAIEALDVNGINYQALITDLELLNKNGKTDQFRQGVEVFEYAKNKYPHIVRRIVSGLPRKAIAELVEIDINNVLYKRLIASYGFDDSFKDWVEKLKKDIKQFRDLKYMKGPENTFWQDVEYTTDKDGNKKAKGSGFKRFYYNLKIENKPVFDEMWERIYTRVTAILKNEEVEKISTEFAKSKSSQDILSKKDSNSGIKLLETILTHRLIWLSLYDNKDTVIYKDKNSNTGICEKPFWDEDLPVKPTALFIWLGFTSIAVNPKNKDTVNLRTDFVSMELRYNSLFEEEEKFRVENSDLIEATINDFSVNYFDLCKLCYEILMTIHKHINQAINGLPALPENYENIEEQTALQVFGFLENKQNLVHLRGIKTDLNDLLIEFESTAPASIQTIIDNIIDNNILM